MKRFADLTEQEILALAISLEEEHGRIYADYADGLKADYPASAKVFTDMAEEEHVHRRQLIDLFQATFGPHIPLIRRQDVKGFVAHEPLWLVRPLGLDKVRAQAEAIEKETGRFYEGATAKATTANVRKLLGDLAAAEREHVDLAQQLGEAHLTMDARDREDNESKTAIRVADRAAGFGRTDGRLDFDARPAVRGSLCDAQSVADVSGRHGGVTWGRDIDGLVRSNVRRRRHLGAR